jgi:hypothetical protein
VTEQPTERSSASPRGGGHSRAALYALWLRLPMLRWGSSGTMRVALGSPLLSTQSRL